MKILLIGSAKNREQFIADFAQNKNTIVVNNKKIQIEFILKDPVLLREKKPYINASVAVFLDEVDEACVRALKIPSTLYVFEDPGSTLYEYPEIFLKNYLKFAYEFGSSKNRDLFFSSSPTDPETTFMERDVKKITMGK